MKMVNYLLDLDATTDIGAVDAPRQSFADHVEPIKIALEQERKVTVRISELFGSPGRRATTRASSSSSGSSRSRSKRRLSMSDLLAVAERTRSVPMLLEEYLARDTPGERPGRLSSPVGGPRLLP